MIASLGSYGNNFINMWRRGGDSNPRTFRLAVFKTAALVHYATSPSEIIFSPFRFDKSKLKKHQNFLFLKISLEILHVKLLRNFNKQIYRLTNEHF